MELAPLRDRGAIRRIVEAITAESRGLSLRIMHVCGTHEWAITHYGIRDMLPGNIRVIAGPGCPVCVTPGNEIDAICGLAAEGVAVTTFGDVLRVPGVSTSLSDAKASGGDVRTVYSIADAIRMAGEERGREFVHFSIGFETTAPMPAIEIRRGLPENLTIFSAHKLIPPAMEFLLGGDVGVDGFICPGHVSTIIGVRPFEDLARRFGRPMVVVGFEPLDVLIGILSVVRQARRGTHFAENAYKRAVRYEGNAIALRALEEVFEVRDSYWRGIGRIGASGLALREEYGRYDAVMRFGMRIPEGDEMPAGCLCGSVLKGAVSPEECPLFGKSCTPAHPVGPCMVSTEGTCAIANKYAAKRAL